MKKNNDYKKVGESFYDPELSRMIND